MSGRGGNGGCDAAHGEESKPLQARRACSL